MQTFIILVCNQNNTSGKIQNFHISEQPQK